MKLKKSYIFSIILFLIFLSCDNNKKTNGQEDIIRKAELGAKLYLQENNRWKENLTEVWNYFLENQEEAMKDSEYGKGQASEKEMAMIYGICSGRILGHLNCENMDDFPYIKNIKSVNSDFYDFLENLLNSVDLLNLAEMLTNKILIIE